MANINKGLNGGIGFSPSSKKEQRTPILILGVRDVIKIVAGAQHVLALTSTGTVFSWGCNEQNQLGRRRATRRHASSPLSPESCALPSGIRSIGVGMYHSFAIHKNGTVYAWGSNNFGQTAVPDTAGLNDAIVAYPEKVPSLRKYGTISLIFGGKDHSIAITETGKCLVWGRIDNKALGILLSNMDPADVIHDSYGRARILKQPHVLPGFSDDDPVSFATACTDHSILITESGKAYSWGFNSQHQAGHPGPDEIDTPTLIQGRHVDGKKLISAAAGGQFSIIVGLHGALRKKQTSRK